MPRNYVDNSYNRSLGRVGMPVGSMPVSRGSSSGSSFFSSAPKTYVDNSLNRSLGRVGLEHGTAVHSRGSNSPSFSFTSSATKTYVDNSLNRSLGRVGMEHGTMVHSKASSTHSLKRDLGSLSLKETAHKSAEDKASQKVYKDNYVNRKLGRVGKPLGSAPIGSFAKPEKKVYVDNYFNRKLGRVGQPLGSQPYSRKRTQTKEMRQAYQDYLYGMDDGGLGADFNPASENEAALELIRRMERVMKWQEEASSHQQPATAKEILQDYSGKTIEFSELKLEDKIGHGGFGDVYFAKWKGTVVAVKKLRVQRVSNRRLQQFADEIKVFCTLDHPAILKFLGACVVTPNLAIVMEYMQISLFEALHVTEDVDLSNDDRKSIIVQVASGIVYLHEKEIAHCDMKSTNVMIDFKGEDVVIAKITDFGLSMMKRYTETSLSSSDFVSNVGTPSYSAPEVLRGELLEQKDMKMADIYSMSLVVYEVLSEEEPFADLSYAQLRKHVGEGLKTPEMFDDLQINADLLDLLQSCWDRAPEKRPTAKKFFDVCDALEDVYNESDN